MTHADSVICAGNFDAAQRASASRVGAHGAGREGLDYDASSFVPSSPPKQYSLSQPPSLAQQLQWLPSSNGHLSRLWPTPLSREAMIRY